MIDLMGSYKISEKLLDKMLSRRIILESGKSLPGLSSLEIDAVIYFTTVSDTSGFVEEFKVTDLADVLGCTVRAAYFILGNLKKKEIISMSAPNWYGTRDIHLLDNDFTGITDYSVNPYINTNRSFFNFSEDGWYKEYKQLSLYAKRTLLVVLSGYHVDYGYRVAINTLQQKLQLKDRRLVVSYLKELEHLLGADFYEISPDKKHRYKFGTTQLKKKNRFLITSKGISDTQDSFFKRYVRIFLLKMGIWDEQTCGGIKQLNIILNEVYAIAHNYIHSGAAAETCLQLIKDAFLSIGVVDDYVIRVIKSSFRDNLNIKLRMAN